MNEKQSAIKTQLDECEAQLKEERRQTEALSERQTATNSISALSDEKLREHLYDAIERVIVYSADSIEIIWRFDKLVA